MGVEGGLSPEDLARAGQHCCNDSHATGLCRVLRARAQHEPCPALLLLTGSWLVVAWGLLSQERRPEPCIDADALLQILRGK